MVWLLVPIVFVQMRPTALMQLHGRARAKCVEVGQWYNAEDRRKQPWIGLRMANIRSSDHLELTLKAVGLARKFPLPFTTKTNKGANWVRMNLEKSGWDFILVETPLRTRSGSCGWNVGPSTGGSLAGGNVELIAKAERPFAPPHARMANQRNKPGKPRPKVRSNQGTPKPKPH